MLDIAKDYALQDTIPFNKLPYYIQTKYDPNVVAKATMNRREDGFVTSNSVTVVAGARSFTDNWEYLPDKGWYITSTVH